MRRFYWEWVESMDDKKRFDAIIKKDIHLIYPMLEYRGYWQTGINGEVEGEGFGWAHHYTCKHLDRESGVCTIYDIRPHICKTFPDEGDCPYKNCKTYDICNGVKDFKEKQDTKEEVVPTPVADTTTQKGIGNESRNSDEH